MDMAYKLHLDENPIAITCSKCCSVNSIVLCHKYGDTFRECKECREVFPTERRYCSDCCNHKGDRALFVRLRHDTWQCMHCGCVKNFNKKEEEEEPECKFHDMQFGVKLIE